MAIMTPVLIDSNNNESSYNEDSGTTQLKD